METRRTSDPGADGQPRADAPRLYHPYANSEWHASGPLLSGFERLLAEIRAYLEFVEIARS